MPGRTGNPPGFKDRCRSNGRFGPNKTVQSRYAPGMTTTEMPDTYYGAAPLQDGRTAAMEYLPAGAGVPVRQHLVHHQL